MDASLIKASRRHSHFHGVSAEFGRVCANIERQGSCGGVDGEELGDVESRRAQSLGFQSDDEASTVLRRIRCTNGVSNGRRVLSSSTARVLSQEWNVRDREQGCRTVAFIEGEPKVVGVLVDGANSASGDHSGHIRRCDAAELSIRAIQGANS